MPIARRDEVEHIFPWRGGARPRCGRVGPPDKPALGPMKTDARNSLNLDVPVDDGSIGRALDELQAKIGVWREAVRDAKQCAEEAARAAISDRKAAPDPGASAPTDEPAAGAELEPIGGDGAAAGIVGDANNTGSDQRRSQEAALEQIEPTAGVDVLEAPGAAQSDPHSPEAADAASSDLESPEVTPEISNATQTPDAPLGVMMPESADMVRARQVLTKAGGKAKEAIDEESEAQRGALR